MIRLWPYQVPVIIGQIDDENDLIKSLMTGKHYNDMGKIIINHGEMDY